MNGNLKQNTSQHFSKAVNMLLPIVRYDTGTIISGNFALLWVETWRIKPSISSNYLTLSKAKQRFRRKNILFPTIDNGWSFSGYKKTLLSKKKFGFVASIILGVIFVTVAVISIIKDSNQNLASCAVVIGQVVSKDIIRIKRYKYEKNHFSFRLNNSNKNFTVFRSYDGYSDLESAIQIGDTLKVYFINKSTVFQVEKNNTVLESFIAYK